MKLHKIARLAQGRAISMEERLNELEKITESRLMRLEDAITSMKDIILKLNEENESLRMKAAQTTIEPFMAAMNTGKDFINYLVEEEQPKEEVKVAMKKQNDSMEKAIRMMRQKFGLPPKVGKKMKIEKAGLEAME